VVALNFLGGVALLMVSVGLYGIASYSVARRTNEIGIRMTLSAGRRSIVWLAQRETLKIVALGAAIGFAASLPIMLLIRKLIFGVAANDLTTPIVLVMLRWWSPQLRAIFLPAARLLSIPSFRCVWSKAVYRAAPARD
jgi:macrolide transport system ATP-binding/permease protein